MPTNHNIKIENNDSKIWHRDRVALDLLQLAQNFEAFTISLNGEGPCAQSLGLYDLLNDVCSRTGFNKQNITIITANLLETHTEYKIEIKPHTKYLIDLQQKLKQAGNNLTKDPYSITNHFGHFIGHSSRFRLAIASWLYRYHRQRTSQTFHSVPTSELHREFLSLEDLWFSNYGIDYVDNAVEFLKHVPFSYDSHNSGPILGQQLYGVLGAYHNIFIDIPCMTYVSGTTFYVDEKIWRPIMTQTPFIAHGPANFIKNLRRFGFKTFDQWWDEGYSEDPPDVQTKEIVGIIDQIAKWDINRVRTVYEEMKPVLEHNYKRFTELKADEFSKIFI